MTDNEALAPQPTSPLAVPPHDPAGPADETRAPAPERPATRPARPRDPHDELLASLGRRFRGAAIRLEFELRTAAARRVFQRDFVYVSQQLHGLEASRRVQGLERQVLADALAAVTVRADAVRTLLMHCAAETRALIALHGHAAAGIEFVRPVRLHATIVSPHVREFLDILGQADDALAQLEKAWLLGVLDADAKSRHVGQCRDALHAFKDVVRTQRQIVGARVREVNALRRTARSPAGAPPGQTPSDRRPVQDDRSGDPPPRQRSTERAEQAAAGSRAGSLPVVGVEAKAIDGATRCDESAVPGEPAFEPVDGPSTPGAATDSPIDEGADCPPRT